MKVKNSIKKVGAVAGSALMVGLSVGAAASLSDFPEPFVEDGEVASQVVVGSTGQVADVVGAVNVAAALGQAAVQTTEEEVPGVATADVDGAEDDTDIRQSWNNFEVDKSSYSQLIRETVEVDGTNHRTLETVSVNGDGLQTAVDNQSAVLTTISDGDIEYEVSYNPGFAVEQPIRILGVEYTVTQVEADELRLGSKEEHRNLAAGDEVTHGPWSFNIIDVDRDQPAVRLDVYEDGEFDSSTTLGQGDNATFGEDDEFFIDVTDIWFGETLDQVHIDTTYSDTVVEEGEDSPFDEDWTVEDIDTDGNTVHSLTLSNKLSAVEDPSEDEDDNEVSAVVSGEPFAGPADYFEVLNLGLTASDHEDVEFGEDMEVDFTDANHQETSLTVSDLTDGATLDPAADDEGVVGVPDSDDAEPDHVYPVSYEIDGEAGDYSVTVEYQDWEHTFEGVDEDGDETYVEASGWGFAVAVDEGAIDDGNLDIGGTDDGTDTGGFAAGHDYVHTSFGAEISHDADAGDEAGNEGVEVDYDEDDTVTVVYDETDQEEIVAVEYHDGNDDAELTDTDDGEETLTGWGSHVVLDDEESASLSLAEEQRFVHQAVGSADEVTTDGETYDAVDWDAQGQLPDMSQLDTEVTESDRDNNHLVLVGGPAVNTLTEELYDAGDIDLDDVEDEQSGAVLQTVENAFADGQHALVVAGYAADDTRNAALYIGQYGTHADALADAGDRLHLTEGDYPTEQ